MSYRMAVPVTVPNDGVATARDIGRHVAVASARLRFSLNAPLTYKGEAETPST